MIAPPKSPSRIDGPLKVTGAAKYSSDYRFERMVYAVAVEATIANGRLVSLETDEAAKMPGVIEIFHAGNIGKLTPPPEDAGTIDERRPPLADDVIRYYGQYIGLVVAESFEAATAAAARVRATYGDVKPPSLDEDLEVDGEPKVESERGDAAAAFDLADVKIDQTYVTATEVHNPIELHATVAIAEGDRFTLFETTQAVGNHQSVMSAILGVETENVRIVMKFLGSGFGGKLWPWGHTTLAAAAAKALGRPVKLVVTRKAMFQTVGHRPRTQQRVRFGASGNGTLVSLRHEYVSEASLQGDYAENCGEATPFFYGIANLRVTSGVARRNVGVPTAMRGPGAVPGLYATELAYDELAEALGVDPVELRIRNEPDRDLSLDIPFSSRHYVECLTTGAQRFGWNDRTHAVGSMRDGDAILGWGMAGCTWIAARFDAEVAVELCDDGSVHVKTGTQDIGTGTYTILAQIAAEATGVSLDRVIVELGDTQLPPGPVSGGSMVTASLVPATLSAVRAATEELAKLSGSSIEERLFEGRHAGTPFEDVLARAGKRSVSGHGKATGTFGDEHPTVSLHSYGAQFVEVAWQPQLARLRVRRIVSVIDAGRIVNDKTARNQIEGGLVMGVGMALLESAHYDKRSGAPVNNNLADYMMVTNADVPHMDVTFIDHPDYALNEFGVRGVGEIGLAGVAPAIASAVYHATGKRVRKVPIEIEDLL